MPDSLEALDAAMTILAAADMTNDGIALTISEYPDLPTDVVHSLKECGAVITIMARLLARKVEQDVDTAEHLASILAKLDQIEKDL